MAKGIREFVNEVNAAFGYDPTIPEPYPYMAHYRLLLNERDAERKLLGTAPLKAAAGEYRRACVELAEFEAAHGKPDPALVELHLNSFSVRHAPPGKSVLDKTAERICPVCFGTGWSDRWRTEPLEHCGICNGTGVRS